MKGFTTKAIHGKYKNNDSHNALRTPIYNNVTFEFENSIAIEEAFKGKRLAHSYSRITNPTVADFEEKINFLADSLGTIAVSSGMAAISNVILAICETGDNIITSKYLFGNTFSLIEETFKYWGLKIKYADFDNLEDIEKNIDNKTKAIFIETITNPQLAVFDLEGIAKIAKKNNILTILDNTVTTPYIFKGKLFGINIEVISTTKYISGGATCVGGVIIDNGNFDWNNISKLQELTKKYGPYTFLNKLRREIYRNLGACLSPQNAYLHTLGLETLALRIEKSCKSTQKIAEHLIDKKKIIRVNYPGLNGNKYYYNAKKLFNNYYGAILTFDLKDKETCFKFMDNLKIIKRATNLNDNKTLIIHPSSTIYSEFDEDNQKELGVTDKMIRLAVGIEDADDLIEDIDNTLEVL